MQSHTHSYVLTRAQTDVVTHMQTHKGRTHTHDSHLPRHKGTNTLHEGTDSHGESRTAARAQSCGVAHGQTQGHAGRDSHAQGHAQGHTPALAQSSGVTHVQRQVHRRGGIRIHTALESRTHSDRATRTPARTPTRARANHAPVSSTPGTAFEGLGGSRRARWVRVRFSSVSGPTRPRRTPVTPGPTVERTSRPHK